MVISIKRASTWQMVLSVFATSAIASLVTFTLTNNSSSFQRDLISAIEQQKICVVSGEGTDGQDGKDGIDGLDGKDGTDGLPGATGAPGTCQIVIGPEGQIGATGPVGPAGDWT
jgi:hypothetical protein